MTTWSRGAGKTKPRLQDPSSVAGRDRQVVAKKLRECLVECGETTDWLAGKLGVPFVRASALLSGSVTPSADERQRIAGLLEGDA